MKFTLLRLFATVTGVAVLLGLGLLITANWRRQLAIQGDLKSQVATWVGFDAVESDFIPNVLYTRPLANDLQHHKRLRVVELKGYNVTPQCIEKLSGIEHIDDLRIISCELSDDDLVHMPQLEIANLLFWNANITDTAADTISQVRGLKMVGFKATAVTEQGAEKLRLLLPEVEVVLLR